jgi:uncharacterized protein YhaN
MYVTGFHIDGFGIYHDQGIRDLPAGLVVFVGDNESGKTTLMEFIRTLLFDFPPKRDKTRNDYEPVRGGNHGGRLQFILQDGRGFTLARPGCVPATLIPAGGSPVQAEPAQTLFGGLDRDTYRHVFAVGLGELQGLGVLSQEGVRGRLFAAGAGLGSASVPAVMESLKKESELLIKKGGRTQRLNNLINELRRIDRKLKELQGQAAAYAEGQRRREHLEEQVAANRQEADDHRRHLARLARLEQARLPWVNRNLAREKAGVLEFARDFPVSGLERLERLERELEKIRQSQRYQEEEARQVEEKLAGLVVDGAILACQESIEALISEREKLVTQKEEYVGTTSAIDQAHAEFHRKLRVLGPGWDADRLRAVDTSLQVRQRVAEFGRQLAAAEWRLEGAQAQVRARAEAVTEAQSRVESATRHLADLPAPVIADDQELARQQEALVRMRGWMHQREVLAEKLLSRMSSAEENKVRAEALHAQLAQPPTGLPWWLGLPWLVAGLALGCWWLFQRHYLPGGLSVGAGLGLAALFFWLSRRQAAVETSRRLGIKREMEQVEETRAGFLGTAADLEEEVGAAEAEISLAARVLDREPPGNAMLLEELAGELEQAAAALREWQARKHEEAQAVDHLTKAQERLDQAQTEVEQAGHDLRKVQEEWGAWLTARGFAEAVRPEGFEAVLQAVENAREAAGVLENHRRRGQMLNAYLAAAKMRIGQVLAACGLRSRQAEPELDVDTLRRALSTALTASQQQKEFMAKLTGVRRELDLLARQGQEFAAEWDGLLRQAGADDAEDFRRRGAAHEHWRGWIKQSDDEEIALRTLSGTREAQEALEDELGRIDPETLQREQEERTGRLRELDDAISQDNQEIGRLKDRLELMEQDRQLGDVLLQQRTLKEQLAEATRRWATLTVCRHLLETARGVYERERQPQVIQSADRFLNIMAHGRYRLLAAVGENGVHLEDLKLARKEEPAWSAGLADQVYLAIRLGLAREFGRHSEPLPVILDDVLVKFDPSRQANAIRLILDFALEQQVLLFSCHPEFLEIIEAVRQDPACQETPVTAYAIDDGIITRIPVGPAWIPAAR